MTSSRNPTPRPRRVAGRTQRTEPVETPAPEAPAPPPVVEPVETPAAEAPAPPPVVEPVETAAVEPSAPTPVVETQPEPADAAPAPARRTTLALVLAIVLLVGVALLEGAYLWGPLADDPKVSSDRPVVISEAELRSVVDTAAQAAVTFSGRSYETYDEQVDAATAMMTDAFAEEFRETTDQVRDEWVEQQTIVTAELEAQAVMTASDQQVEALVFLSQFIERKGAQVGVTPYRISVTMIRTDQGWLVSDVESA